MFVAQLFFFVIGGLLNLRRLHISSWFITFYWRHASSVRHEEPESIFNTEVCNTLVENALFVDLECQRRPTASISARGISMLGPAVLDTPEGEGSLSGHSGSGGVGLFFSVLLDI